MSQNMIFRIEYLLFGRRTLWQHMQRHTNCRSFLHEGRAIENFPFFSMRTATEIVYLCEDVTFITISIVYVCVFLFIRLLQDMVAMKKKNNTSKYKHQRTLFSPFSRAIYFISLYRRLHDFSTSCVLFSLPREIQSKCLNAIDDFHLTFSFSVSFSYNWFSSHKISSNRHALSLIKTLITWKNCNQIGKRTSSTIKKNAQKNASRECSQFYCKNSA